jgi:tetratricopeptide (TPR) repeat protein
MSAKSSLLIAMFWSGIALPQDSAGGAAILNNEAISLVEAGYSQQAESMYRSALVMSSSDQLTQAKIANNLGWLYLRQDRYQEAEQMFRQALQWRQANLAPNSFEIAYSFNNLAVIYRIEGRDWEARNLLEPAVRMLREFHPEAPELPVIMSNLAVVLCRFQAYDQAEDLLRSALNRSELEHGAASLEVGAELNDMGQLLEARQDFQNAAPMYTQAAGIFERLGRRATSELATALANLGGLLEQQHQDVQARQTEQRALDLLTSGANAPLRARILQNLGNIVAASGNAAGSLPYFEQSLNLQEKTLGAEHPATAHLLLDYADATRHAGQKLLARKLQKRAREILVRLNNKSPSQLTVSLDSLRDLQ